MIVCSTTLSGAISRGVRRLTDFLSTGINVEDSAQTTDETDKKQEDLDNQKKIDEYKKDVKEQQKDFLRIENFNENTWNFFCINAVLNPPSRNT